MWEYRATLVRVIDGDTFVLDIDCGFHITKRETIRLFGIDCPEIGTAEGKRAKQFTTEWFGHHALGVRIQTHRNEAGEVLTFGRWVAKVYGLDLVGGAQNDLAEALRTAGFVKVAARQAPASASG